MQFIAKTTPELTDADWKQLADLFNESFKRDVSVEYFKKKYNSSVRYISCYHGFMIDDKTGIVGAMTIIPFEYQFFEKNVIFGNIIDLMIHTDHRNNILNFKVIYDKLLARVDSKIDFIYAVPNPNAHLYFTKILKWHEIGKLNYYIWPVKVTKLFKLPGLLDTVFRPFNNLAQLLFSRVKYKVFQSPIKKVISNDFLDYRYSDMYKTLNTGDKTAWYRIYNENGVATAYIIDIEPMDRKWMAHTIASIYKLERKVIDVIIYISNNNLGTFNILKTPAKFEPRPLPLIGKVINSEHIDDRILQLSNWRFNLSDFDVR